MEEKEKRYTDDEIKQHIRRYESLKADRTIFESNWQEIAEYIIPERANITSATNPGEKKTSKIYDTTALDELELWASGINGLMTNEALNWFALEMEDDSLNADQDVQIWLSDTVNRMHNSVRSSNFQMEIYELYLDAGSLGTSSLYIDEGKETDLTFQARHVDEICITEDSDGYVDTLYRKFSLTARQAKQKWGEDKLTKPMKEALQKDDKVEGTGKDTEFDILHCIYPRSDDKRLKNSDGNPAETPESLPFASLYISCDEKNEGELIDEGGYHEFPYAVPRTKKMTGEKYGRSPAWNALPDIKMVNAMAKTYLRRLQKETDPPIQMPDEAYALPLKLGPGGVNFYSDPGGTRQAKIEPILTGGQLQFADTEVEKRRDAIRRKFFHDLWILPDQPNMTATEVMERIQQKLRIIGPFLGRFQNELLRPIVQRVFGLLYRAGKLLETPPALQAGGQIRVVFINPISDAQKAYEGESLAKALTMLIPMAQMKPEVMDNIDADGVARFYWNAFRAPAKLLFKQEQVNADREAAQQQQAQMQQGQELLAATQGVKNLKGTAIEDVLKGAIGGYGGEGITATQGA